MKSHARPTKPASSAGALQSNKRQQPQRQAKAGVKRGVHAASSSAPRSSTTQPPTVDRTSTLKRAKARAPAARQLHPSGSVKAAELLEFSPGQAARPIMNELYRRAEDQLRKRRKNQGSKPGVPKSADVPQRLLHELQVHQVELEMQNAELRNRDRMEAGLEK
jgi:hypothetical protein